MVIKTTRRPDVIWYLFHLDKGNMGEVITNIAKVSPDEWNTLDEFSSFNISLASLNTRIVLVREHTIFKRKEPKKRTSWNVFSNNRYQGIFLLKTKCKTLAGKSCLAG